MRRLVTRRTGRALVAVALMALAFAAGGCGGDGDGGGGDAVVLPDAPGGMDVFADAGAPPDVPGAVDVVTAADTPADGATAPDAAADTAADAALPPPPCGTDSPEALAACVDEARAVAHLEALVGARPTGSGHWQAAQDYCAAALAEYGFAVERQAYGGGVNVIGTRPGTSRPDELVVVAAHYDHIPGCPGADDNASGVAGALEVARALARVEHARTLVIGCWDEQERGLTGSQAFASRLSALGARVVVYFNFEMIGYASSEPNTQRFPPGFGLLFPGVQALAEARGWRGDFIANITNPAAAPFSAAMAAYGERIGRAVIEVPLSDEQTTWDALADLRRSDHASFWAAGYPAIMVTDTSEFRNPNYHCRGGEDSLDTLDTGFLRDVAALTVAAAAAALAGEDDVATPAPRSECDLDAAVCPQAGDKCSAVLDAWDLWV
jgi:hypothetical protein